MSQLTSAGSVKIGKAPDGRFHVLWSGISVASAETLTAALEAACGGNWTRETEGGRLKPMQVSTLPEHWFLAPQTEEQLTPPQ